MSQYCKIKPIWSIVDFHKKVARRMMRHEMYRGFVWPNIGFYKQRLIGNK